MTKTIVRVLHFLLFFLFASSGFPQAYVAHESGIRTQIQSSHQSIAPDTQFTLAITLTPTQKWKVYWQDPSTPNLPPTIQWTASQPITHIATRWPTPPKSLIHGIVNYGYTKPVTLLADFKLNNPTPKNTPITIQAIVDWLACDDVCIPESQTLSQQLKVGEVSQFSSDKPFISEQEGQATLRQSKNVTLPKLKPISTPKTDQSPQLSPNPPPQHALWLLITFAFLGGLLLNIMPCVFPILSLKLLSLAKANSSDQSQGKKDAIGYTVGVLLSMLIFFIMITFLKAGGASIGWGFHLQSPIVIAILIYVMIAIGLSLLDLAPIPQSIYTLSSRVAGLRQNNSIFTGVLAVIVATPCTAPFMAAAIGAAFVQPPLNGLIIFISLGLGFAAPFLVLALAPSAIRFLPKPGPWLATFKEAMAFPMFLTALWLLWVLNQQSGCAGVFVVLTGILSMTLSIWWQKKSQKTGPYIVLFLLLLASLLYLPSATSQSYLDKSPQQTLQTIKSLKNQGKAVLVDVTADWCLTCKLNEKRVLDTPEIQRYLKQNNITLIKLDWTKKNDAITQYLKQYNRAGVPLYVYYPSNNSKEQTPIILPQILKKSDIKNLI